MKYRIVKNDVGIWSHNFVPAGPALWYGPEKGWEPVQVKK